MSRIFGGPVDIHKTLRDTVHQNNWRHAMLCSGVRHSILDTPYVVLSDPAWKQVSMASNANDQIYPR